MKVDDSRMKDHKLVIRLKSESGDNYTYRVKKNITPDELEQFLREKNPDEWETNEGGENDGPGFHGSYLYILDENGDETNELK